MTAFLNAAGYTNWELGIFRGAGAIVGVMGTYVFPYFSQRFGLIKASFFGAAEETFFVVLAVLSFSLHLITALTDTAATILR